ncbi:TldD/PmbA family protein [Anaerocolumna sp. MB42-C2]|uniref:TldD/PmbA family protein n=1 Tax=Anaerocolumna sp. MB42-C2 TaxID=3070997 RepID=UPI0027E0CA06|nr:TldD/PmbA family protein [Anaerocolumna sp. MB42-C2]WMJ86544.1 TldD/PmbA family protein [Anaerocolumna sp. MB42-C2]
MKVKSSHYLKQVKPLLKTLLNSLLEHYGYASILASDSKAMIYSVSKRGTTISEDDILSGRGFVTKVYDGTSYGEYSFNEITADKIPHILNKIHNSVIPLKKYLPAGITVSEYKTLQDEAKTIEESTEYIQNPEELGDEKIIALLTGLSQEGRAFDEKILDTSASLRYQQYHKLFLSKNKEMEQNILWTTGSLMVMASRGEEIKYYFKGYSNLGGTEMLSDMREDVKSVAKTALELLDSEPIKPGEYDCICTPEVTGMIVHEAFGHGVEMDMFVKDRALAKKYIGEYVASPLITMHDGAAAANETATYFFDDEGVISRDTVIIDKGILKSGISDSQTAMFLSTPPTGNGRRESYERKAYTRMTNTYFEAGKDKLEDMIASISHGYLLENASSGMEDPKNWGIQCMVNIAREIKDGKFTGKIYSPIVLTGYVPDLLKSISMISDNKKLGGGGFCGKGYKEWVKVSDGGPYIKAKIRLG